MKPSEAEEILTRTLGECYQEVTQPGLPSNSKVPPRFRGIIGHFPVYFPEEIAYAAGLFPMNILGGGNKVEVQLADARLGSFICSICRSTTELGLNRSLSRLSGFITHPICDPARHLAGIWGRTFPEQFSEILYLPQNVNTDGAVCYLYSEYQRLRRELEGLVDRSISDDAIRNSIAIYNENRRLLRDLYQIKRETPWRVSWTEAYLLLRGRTRMACEEHNALLKQALNAIRARRSDGQDKPRVVFLGGFCEQPPLEMLETIEDACFVVDDDLLIGLRWFTGDVPETGDPIYALAESYVNRSEASPVQHDSRKPKETVLMNMMNRSKAEAAILTAAKFCEPGLDDQVACGKHLEKLGIPYLVIEFEEKMTSFEQVGMQVETFAESLMFEFSRVGGIR
ncbi:MAG TPA: 2-hydroxyacyl-CoA dehydratase [Terriglobales bacterium]|nr:2-hydroxyacyl-CoA dehydratase [Terriglobales bacterium]